MSGSNDHIVKPKNSGAMLPYQNETLELIKHHQVLFIEKSRRTGLSWSLAALAALTAGKSKGMNVFYMGYNHDMAREFIDYVGGWAKAFEIACDGKSEQVFDDPDNPDKFIKGFMVNFASGFKVHALSSSPRNLRGKQGLVIIDEAAFHNDLAEVLKSAFALLMWGGRVIINSTHDGALNPFNEVIQEIRAGKKPYGLQRITFDDALKDGLYRKICEKSSQEWSPEAEDKWRQGLLDTYGAAANEELHCIPSAGTGSWLRLALIEQTCSDQIPVIRLSKDQTFSDTAEPTRRREIESWLEDHVRLFCAWAKDPSFVGMDIARSGDLSVIWVLAKTQNLLLETVAVIELRNIPFEQQKQILWFVIDSLPRFCGGKLDRGGIGSMLSELTVEKYGECIEGVQFSQSWYRENMPGVKADFEDDNIRIPKDLDIVEDLRMVKEIEGVPKVPKDTRRKGKDGMDRHGDAAPALALCHAASRSEIIDYAYIPVKKSHDEKDFMKPNHQDDMPVHEKATF